MLRDNPTKFDAARERRAGEPPTPATQAWLAELEAREKVWRGRTEHEIRGEMERALARRFAGQCRRVSS